MAAVAVVGVVVSGCGGPDQAGAAVIVGDTSVSLGSVQDQLTSALARVPAASKQQDTGAQVARDIVTNEILRGLLQQQAAAAGITVSDTDVDTFIAQQGGADALLQNSILGVDDLRGQVRDNLVAIALAKRAVGGLQVTADLVGAASKDEAVTDAKKLAAGGADAASLFTNPQASKRGMVYTGVTDAGVAGTALFGTPVGDTVYFQPDAQQATWIVFRVTGRRTDVPSSAAAVNQISQDQLALIGRRLMQPISDQVGIRVNPRYGVWDPIALRVVAADQVSGGILPSAAG